MKTQKGKIPSRDQTDEIEMNLVAQVQTDPNYSNAIA